jgi:hypothetical protein
MGQDLKCCISTSKITSAMFNKNGKIYMVKKHLATLQTNLDTLLFVASYYVESYYRFLNTDHGS